MMALVAHHLWQSTLVAAFAGLLTLAFRHHRAQVRYGIWLSASLKFLVPFAFLVSAGSHLGWRAADGAVRPQIAQVVDFISLPFSAPPAVADPAVPVVSGVTAAESSTSLVLLTIWLAGAATVLGVWFLRWRRVAAIVRSGAPAATGPELHALRRLEAIVATRRPLPLVFSDSLLEPGIFGIVKPVLVWPRAMAAHLVDGQIDAILAHELSHVRRRDNLAAAAHMLVQAAFWFHPFVWWIGSRLVEERERACDEEVVSLGTEPTMYAKSLLATCRICVESRLACVSGVTGSDLRKRVEHVMANDARVALNGWNRVLLAIVATAALVSPVLVGAVSTSPSSAQAPASDPQALAFEVVSIKRHTSGGPSRARIQPGGRFAAVNVPLLTMIRQAYEVLPLQVLNAPDWLASEGYDVLAKAPAGVELGSRMAPLMRGLLNDRFRFKAHIETRQMPIFELVVARRDRKLGSKVEQSLVDCSSSITSPTPRRDAAGRTGQAPALSRPDEPQCALLGTPGRYVMRGFPMSRFSRILGSQVDRVVIDKTGLAGAWNLELEFTPAQMPNIPLDALPPGVTLPSADAPSLFTALQEQLGLELEPTKGTVEVLVVDRVEKPLAD